VKAYRSRRRCGRQTVASEDGPQIGERENGMDARQSLRQCRIDVLDFRVRLLTANKGCMQQARERDVVDEAAGAPQ
jgi:hypothetical protein